MSVSFASDIRPLFRDSPDIDSMQGYGLNLSSYEEVKARAREIYACLTAASLAGGPRMSSAAVPDSARSHSSLHCRSHERSARKPCCRKITPPRGKRA